MAASLRAVAPLSLLIATVVILFRYPPQRFSFYPPCPIYIFFHLQCPGCGATRALAALLHGNLREALYDNALFTVTFPFVAFWSIRNYLHFLEHKPFNWHRLPQPAIYTAILCLAAFMVVRNF